MEGMPSLKKGILSAAAIAAFFLIPEQLLAMDTFMVGPRAMGMAGANVASPVDTNAQYYNPAQFGFFKHRDAKGQKTVCDNCDIGRKKWELDVNAAIGYRLHNDLGKYIDDLSKIDHDLLSSTGITSESDLETLIKLVKNLDGLDKPGNGISTDVNGGASVRVGHMAVGARVYGQSTGRVIGLDTNNLGLSISGATLSTDIIGVTMDPTYVSLGYTFQVFDATQQAILQNPLGANLTLEAVQRLDFIAAQEGITSADAQGTVDILDNVAQDSGTANSLDQNTTTVILNGFGVLEVPISYGYAINDHLSIGANVKLMKGRVYGNEVIVFDQDSGDTLDKTDERYEESTTFGIDVGIMARFQKINLGLIARNINSPSFDGPTIPSLSGGTIKFDDVTIDPQLTAGVAFIPTKTLTIEADLDLTKNETTLADYDTQNFGIGIEWDILRILALRAGTYKNLAESDIGWVYTTGLGVNMYATRIDIAATYSDSEEQFDEDEYPKEFKVALELSVDF